MARRWRSLVWLGCVGAGIVALTLASRPPVVAADEAAEDISNAYLAGSDLTAAELVEFLERMQRKPETIRNRPGFSEALLDAADRLLAARPEPKSEGVALLVKFDVLAAFAAAGDDDAAGQLVQMSERYAADARPK